MRAIGSSGRPLNDNGSLAIGLYFGDSLVSLHHPVRAASKTRKTRKRPARTRKDKHCVLTSERTAGGGSGQPDVTLTSTYNALGDRTNLVDNLGTVGRITYTYDAAHRVVTIAQSFGATAGPKVQFGYDDGNRKTWESRYLYSSGGRNPVDVNLTTTFSYDAANRLTTLTHQLDSGFSITPLATYVYGYANRLTSETNAEGSVTYAYDSTNQLTTVTGARSETYGYDLNGNRNTTGYTTGSGNQQTASPNTTYTYDAEGNLTAQTDTSTGKVTTYSYDYRNRMTGATRKTTAGGAIEMQATYTYDALGRRIGTKVDADGAGAGSPVQTWYVYDGDNTYADFDGSGTVTKRYLYGLAIDELLARTDSGGTRAWYLTDKLGTVRDISDNTGAIIYHAAYDSYGNVTSSSGSGGDRFGFTAREYDAETSLQYNRFRYYDPKTGRWTQQDPIGFQGSDLDLYAYCFNSPTTFVDAWGLKGKEDTLHWDANKAGGLGGLGGPIPGQGEINENLNCVSLQGWIFATKQSIVNRTIEDSETRADLIGLLGSAGGIINDSMKVRIARHDAHLLRTEQEKNLLERLLDIYDDNCGGDSPLRVYPIRPRGPLQPLERPTWNPKREPKYINKPPYEPFSWPPRKEPPVMKAGPGNPIYYEWTPNPFGPPGDFVPTQGGRPVVVIIQEGSPLPGNSNPQAPGRGRVPQRTIPRIPARTR